MSVNTIKRAMEWAITLPQGMIEPYLGVGWINRTPMTSSASTSFFSEFVSVCGRLVNIQYLCIYIYCTYMAGIFVFLDAWIWNNLYIWLVVFLFLFFNIRKIWDFSNRSPILSSFADDFHCKLLSQHRKHNFCRSWHKIQVNILKKILVW